MLRYERYKMGMPTILPMSKISLLASLITKPTLLNLIPPLHIAPDATRAHLENS